MDRSAGHAPRKIVTRTSRTCFCHLYACTLAVQGGRVLGWPSARRSSLVTTDASGLNRTAQEAALVFGSLCQDGRAMHAATIRLPVGVSSWLARARKLFCTEFVQ